MKMSVKTRYALRAMLCLAQAGDGALLGTRAIAQAERLPEKFLEQLMSALRRAGLVTVTRGQAGGSTLARRPSELTLLEIVEAIEGPLHVAGCAGANCCSDPAECAINEALGAADDAFRARLASVTLADVAARQAALDAAGGRRRGPGSSIEYFI